MRKIYSTLLTGIAIVAFGTAQAQTTHDVIVEGMSFTPANLEIEVGDIVRWTNNGGFHSIDGSTDVFPGNPESFGNSAGAAGWEYEFTFNTEGDYEYRCGIHTQTMAGSISVGEPMNVSNAEDARIFTFFPNPVVNELNWTINENVNAKDQIIRIFDVNGKMVSEFNLASKTRLDVSSFENGMYFYAVNVADKTIQSGKFLIAK